MKEKKSIFIRAFEWLDDNPWASGTLIAVAVIIMGALADPDLRVAAALAGRT